MLKNLIVAGREKAGRSTQAARDYGLKIREAQGKQEPTADLEVAFTKAVTEATADLKDLQRLEAELVLETEAKKLETPRESFTGRIVESDRDTPIRNREDRREKQRLTREREMYARAGVANMEQFRQFRDAHAEAFTAYILGDNRGAMQEFEKAGFKPSESMALVSTTGDLGGFLVPDEFRNEVLRDLAGFAVMRPMCRVERTGKSALVFPSLASATTDADIYSSGYAGAWKAEGYVTGGTAPTVQNQPTFGQTRIPVHAWAPNAVEVTQELLSDNEADLDGILAEVIAETLALDEDSGFLNGSGVNQPLGLTNTLSGTTVTAVNSGHATALTYEGLIDLWTNIPAQYRQNMRFLMSSLTYGAILKLKDGNGMPIFPVNATPGTLWGKPIAFSEFMAEIAADTHPIVAGDFRYYGIADRQELRVQRLVERYAPNIGILPTARVGGQVMRTAAFRKLKIAV